MKLEVILRFRQDSAGAVPLEVLQRLGLPMPEDVLEQFLCDHGTKDEFQQQYGQLDIHAIEWNLIPVSAASLLNCSIFSEFTGWVETVRTRAHSVTVAGWDQTYLPRGAAEHWQQYGTWMRPPLFLSGDLVGSDRTFHLVEGHTRIGFLKGLVESGAIADSSFHEVWVGKGCKSTEQPDQWQDVLRKERIPFLDWMMKKVGDEGKIGKIASELIDAKYASYPKKRINKGNDLSTLLEFIKNDSDYKIREKLIIKAHSEWESLIGF